MMADQSNAEKAKDEEQNIVDSSTTAAVLQGDEGPNEGSTVLSTTETSSESVSQTSKSITEKPSDSNQNVGSSNVSLISLTTETTSQQSDVKEAGIDSCEGTKDTQTSVAKIIESADTSTSSEAENCMRSSKITDSIADNTPLVTKDTTNNTPVVTDDTDIAHPNNVCGATENLGAPQGASNISSSNAADEATLLGEVSSCNVSESISDVVSRIAETQNAGEEDANQPRSVNESGTSELSSVAESKAVVSGTESVTDQEKVSIPDLSSGRNIIEEPKEETGKNKSVNESTECQVEKEVIQTSSETQKSQVGSKSNISPVKEAVICDKKVESGPEKRPTQNVVCNVASNSSREREETLPANDRKTDKDDSNMSKTVDPSTEKKDSKNLGQISRPEQEQQKSIVKTGSNANDSTFETSSEISECASLKPDKKSLPIETGSSVSKPVKGSPKTLDTNTCSLSSAESICLETVKESQVSANNSFDNAETLESDQISQRVGNVVGPHSDLKNSPVANSKENVTSGIDQTDQRKIVSNLKTVEKKHESKLVSDTYKEKAKNTSNTQADSKVCASNLDHLKSEKASSTKNTSEKSDLLSAIEAVKVEAEILKSKQKTEKSPELLEKEEVEKSTSKKSNLEKQALIKEGTSIDTSADNKVTAPVTMSSGDDKLNGSSVPDKNAEITEEAADEPSKTPVISGKFGKVKVVSTDKNSASEKCGLNSEAFPSRKESNVSTVELNRVEVDSEAESKSVSAEISKYSSDISKTVKLISKEALNVCPKTSDQDTSKNLQKSGMETGKNKEIPVTTHDQQVSSNDESKDCQVLGIENNQHVKDPVAKESIASKSGSLEPLLESNQDPGNSKADSKAHSSPKTSEKAQISVSEMKQVEERLESDSKIPSKIPLSAELQKNIPEPSSETGESQKKSEADTQIPSTVEKSKEIQTSSSEIITDKEKSKQTIKVPAKVEKAPKTDQTPSLKTKEVSKDVEAGKDIKSNLSSSSKNVEVSPKGVESLVDNTTETALKKSSEVGKLKDKLIATSETKQDVDKAPSQEITFVDTPQDVAASSVEVKKDAENSVGVENKPSTDASNKRSPSLDGKENTDKCNKAADKRSLLAGPDMSKLSESNAETIKQEVGKSSDANSESPSNSSKTLPELIRKVKDDPKEPLKEISITTSATKEPPSSEVIDITDDEDEAKPAEAGNVNKASSLDDEQQTAKPSDERLEVKPGSAVNKGPHGPVKPKTTKVMPSLREIRKIPPKPEAGKGSMSVSIVKRPRLSEGESDIVRPTSSSGPESISKPRFSVEDDPLLNITSECRVELEITKIPANCQLKTEPGGKPVFVLNRNSAGPSSQDVNRRQNSMLKNFMTHSNQPRMGRPRMGRPPKDPNRMIQVRPMDSSMMTRPTYSKRGRKRGAMTIDMTRQPGPHGPPVKVVRTDPQFKHRMNMAQMQRMYPKSGPAGPSPKTTSALEMLLMNRGVSHNPPISDASVANFCQVEELVTEPDMFSTPINQLKNLSKGPANSILKQIAYGSQQFGAITISPVNPTPKRVPPTAAPPGSSYRPSPRPAQIVRSSSIDDVIDSVAAGEGEISPKCLLELNSAGEPKKKRGRPRKIVPGQPTYPQFQPESLQCAPDLFFMHQERQPIVRPAAPKVSAAEGMQAPSTPVTPVKSPPVKSPPATPMSVTPEGLTESSGEPTETPTTEGEDGKEPKKLASGRAARMCTIKEPKKKKDGATPKTGEKSHKKKKKDEEPAEPDPADEARKQQELEEEAKRKAELKEKRQLERQKRTELRTKLLAEKKAKLKRRAEERKRQYYEKKRKLQEEKAEMERRRALAPPETFSEETQMGDENDSVGELIRNKKGRMEVIDPESSKEFKVHQVAEYQWPLQGGEFFMLQEQISQYLGVKSFKRKYPDIKRRTIEAEERTFLCDSGLVSETMCDLGLTALRSADVLDIMFSDFHDKYEEFRQHLRDMQAKEFSLKQLALAGKPTGEQLTSIEKAVQSAARWNSSLNKSRQESRKCCLDLQTFIIQYPRPPKVDNPKIGNYPISLIPGQFTDYYKPYSAAELRYLPLNTVLYGPIKPYNVVVRESQNDYYSESDESSSDGSSCSSSDASDSEESVKEATTEVEVPGQEGVICKICNGNRKKNKGNVPEVLIQCAQCTGCCHPSCLDLAPEMVPHIQRYDWQCTDCKRCAQCKEVSDEDKMLFCDLCDRGYHIYCVGLRKVPVGRWHCQECAVCATCAVHEPGPTDTALWHHEYKKGGKGGKHTYLRSFCENCAKDQTPAEGNILRRES